MLTDDTFDQDTYLRLVRHVTDAISAFMELWQRELTRAFERARTTHDLGVELVRLRALLGARLVLAQHPSWPPELRNALVEGLRVDLSALQADLVEAVGRSTDRGRFDRGRSDEMVAIVTRNSLTTLLPPPGPPTAPTSPTSAPAGRAARRILF